jgi:hypothetical protein
VKHAGSGATATSYNFERTVSVMADGTSLCPHISGALNDKSLGDIIRKKYTSVVSWSAYRSQVLRPTKRRKVRCILIIERFFSSLSV